MPAQTEFVNKTFDTAFDNFRKATEATLQMQQDLFRQWSVFWPGFPKPQPSEQFQQLQNEWSQTVTDVTRKYLEQWDRQFKTGMESLEKGLKATEARDIEAIRQNMIELWQKSFDCLKNVAQIQMQAFQTGIEKWIELARKTKN